MVKSNSFEHGLHTRTHYAIELSTDAQRMPDVGKRRVWLGSRSLRKQNNHKKGGGSARNACLKRELSWRNTVAVKFNIERPKFAGLKPLASSDWRVWVNYSTYRLSFRRVNLERERFFLGSSQSVRRRDAACTYECCTTLRWNGRRRLKNGFKCPYCY